MNYRLDDRVALVTGAAEGIGWATARLLGDRGAAVVLVGRVQDERLQSRLDELTANGVSARAMAADLTDPGAIAATYKQVFSEFRRLDVLVANAGALGDAPLGMISEDLLSRTVDVNLLGTIRHIQSASRLMRRSNGGSIIAVGSIMGLAGNVGQVPYSAAKAGLIGAVRSASKELAPHAVRCNVVAPGFIETKLTANLNPEVRSERIRSVAIGRAGTAEEVAELIAFLASDAAAYITGQVIGVDGGLVV